MYLVESLEICRHKFEYLKIKQARVYKYLVLLKCMVGYNLYLKYLYKRIKQSFDSSLEFDL